MKSWFSNVSGEVKPKKLFRFRVVFISYETAQAINQLVEYQYYDEMFDYQSEVESNRDFAGHIFEDKVKVDVWLNDNWLLERNRYPIMQNPYLPIFVGILIWALLIGLTVRQLSIQGGKYGCEHKTEANI